VHRGDTDIEPAVLIRQVPAEELFIDCVTVSDLGGRCVQTGFLD
jgi:hypothetical protein